MAEPIDSLRNLYGLFCTPAVKLKLGKQWTQMFTEAAAQAKLVIDAADLDELNGEQAVDQQQHMVKMVRDALDEEIGVGNFDKIRAIRWCRQFFGLSLGDAKLWVEKNF